jgi:hypothetical protein
MCVPKSDFQKIYATTEINWKGHMIEKELIFNNTFITDDQNKPLKAQAVLTRINIARVRDLNKRNLTQPIKTALEPLETYFL